MIQDVLADVAASQARREAQRLFEKQRVLDVLREYKVQRVKKQYKAKYMGQQQKAAHRTGRRSI